MKTDTEAGQKNAGVVAPPPLIYAGSLVVGLIIQENLPVPFLPRAIRSWLGGTLVGTGLMLGIPAVRAMRRAQTPLNPTLPVRAIVTQGPFLLSRNPIYLSFTLLYAGIATLSNSLWSFLLLPITLRIMNRGVIDREEKYLEHKFGAQYLAYKERVRRWL